MYIEDREVGKLREKPALLEEEGVFLVSPQKKCSPRVPSCALSNRSIFPHTAFLHFLRFVIKCAFCTAPKTKARFQKRLRKQAPPV